MSPTDGKSLEPAALDPRWVTLVAAIAPRVLGRDDRTGASLAAAVARTSELYTTEREAIALAAGALAARLRFYLLRDLPKIQGPLAELAAVSALPEKKVWRVIDVGAGLGTTSLGLAELARRRGVESVEILALEREAAALDVFASVAREAQAAGLVAPLRIDARPMDLERAELARLPRADLIVVGLTLNELFLDREDRLDAREAVLRALAERLDEGGSLIVLEPATRAITRELMQLRDRLAAAPEMPHVFAPCLRDAPCPLLERERDWCHAELALALPEPLAELAEAAGLRRERLTYSYLILRRDSRRLWDLAERDPRAYRIVGGPIGSKGKTEWEGCGAQALVRLRRLDRERTPSNAALDGAARGTLLRLDRELEDGADLRARPGVVIDRLR